MKKLIVVFAMTLPFFWADSALATLSLRGSAYSLELQNKQANREKLSRIREKNLGFFEKKKILVPLPNNKSAVVDRRLSQKYAWCRPWTKKFVLDTGKSFRKKFGVPIQINSAVRTVEYQEKLRRWNWNAARAKTGLKRSSHLTGSTVDIAKKGMSIEQIRWMRAYLLGLEKKGLIEAVEEYRQSVFHVMVFKKYHRKS